MQVAEDPGVIEPGNDNVPLIGTVKELIGMWPEPSPRQALADDLRLTKSAVDAWATRGRIPVEYLYDVLRAARLRGYHRVTAEVLVYIHRRRS